MRKRLTPILAVPLAAVALPVLVAVAAAGDLPDPIATHWSAGGAPDGHAPLWAFVAGTAVVQLLACAIVAVQARSRAARGLRLTSAPYVWATVVFVAAIALTVIAANEGAAGWREADRLELWSVAVPMLAGALAALAAHLLERRRPVAAVDAATVSQPSVALAPGERVVWTRGLVSRPAAVGAAALGVGFLVGGVLTGGAAGWLLVLGGIVAAVAAGTLAEIVATVDERGLTVAFGPLGWPRKVVPLADVAAAEPTEIDPWSVGGWGYRKVPKRPGATAIVLRGGEALRVVRRDGRELLVSVPDAATAAGLLAALRQR